MNPEAQNEQGHLGKGLSRPHRVAVGAIIGAVAIFSLLIWNSTKDFRMYQTWEEDAMLYMAGKNLTERGFFTNLLLDDYAVGGDPGAHPLLYTHFPNITGVLQGLLISAGITDIHYIKLVFIPLFLVGLLYYFLTIRKLFSDNVALAALAITGTNYFGALSWADSTLHSMHWLVLFGALYHFLCIPKKGETSKNTTLHVAASAFYFTLSEPVTFIHTLFIGIAIGAFYVLKVHRVRFVHVAIIMCVPIAFFALHQARIIGLLGWDVWLQDQTYNIKKASSVEDYVTMLKFYADNGIIIWPAEHTGISLPGAFKVFKAELASKEGVSGLIVLAGLIVAALVSLATSIRRRIAVDKFGIKVLTLFFASIAWNLIFVVHATDYVTVTPYIMLSGAVNLGWALLICLPIDRLATRQPGAIARTPLLIGAAILAFVLYNRVADFIARPPRALPASEALHKYKGASFYTTVFPLYVSYYTGEWALGTLTPQAAVSRDYMKAKHFLQRDKDNADKYSNPDYYLVVVPPNTPAHVTDDFMRRIGENFAQVECGNQWCIFDMKRQE